MFYWLKKRALKGIYTFFSTREFLHVWWTYGTFCWNINHKLGKWEREQAWLTRWSWRWKLRTADPPGTQLLWWRRAGSRLSSGLWSQRSGTRLNTSHGSLSPSARHSFKWKSDTEAYSLRLLTDVPERTHACLELQHQHSPLVLVLCFDVWSSGTKQDIKAKVRWFQASSSSLL